jgi:diguanylate cyclase (GGDEF)-like protein
VDDVLNDIRVSRYRKAAEALGQGQFDVSIPIGAPDEVAGLGRALRALARTLKTQAEQSVMLAKITQKMNEGLVIEDVLDHVYENFFSLIPYDRIGLALLEEGRAVVRAHWARSKATEIKLPLGYSAGLATSSLAEIIRTGKPRILNDLETYLVAHPQSDSTRRIVAEGMRSSLTCPLMAKGEPFGFLFFSSMTKNTYTGDHQELFLQIAGQLAVILEKSRLYENLLQLTEQLQVAKVALEQEATRDSLTELWNRRSILDLLKREIARAGRDGKPLAAVMIDIDHFKPINDRIGHLIGDEVLREVTRRIAATLRSADVLGRIGGEEFLIILYPADELIAVEVMERARLACSARPIAFDGGEVEVTISLGAAVAASPHEVELTDLLATADRALYRAKDGGRDRSDVETLA